jgi:hypothetical protein
MKKVGVFLYAKVFSGFVLAGDGMSAAGSFASACHFQLMCGRWTPRVNLNQVLIFSDVA